MFTESDIQKILGTVGATSASKGSSSSGHFKSSLSTLPPCLELVSGGLVIEHHARSMVEAAIFTNQHSSRITLLELASLANLEVKKVEALLPPDDRPEWGRVGNSTIVCRDEYVALQADLQQQLKNTFVTISLYCKEKSIDIQLLRKILRDTYPGYGIEWIGNDRDIICTTSLYKTYKEELTTQLQKILVPTDISTLLLEKQLPTSFLSHLVKNILKEDGNNVGAYKGRIFTPHIYTETRRDTLIQKLQNDNILDFESFRNEGVQNVEELLNNKLPGVHFLETYIVTNDYVDQLKASIQQRLDTEGWAQATDTNHLLSLGDVRSLLILLRRHLGDYELHGGHIVSKALKHSLVERAVEFASQQAGLASREKSKGDIQAKRLRQQDISLFLSGSSSLPPPALSSMLETICPLALDSFSRRIATVQEEAERNIRDTFWERGYVRIQIHYTALQAINESALRSKLAADLVEYSREILLGQLDKYETFMVPDVIPKAIFDLKIALQSGAKTTAKPEQILKDIDKHLEEAMRVLSTPPMTDTVLEHQKQKFMSDLRGQLQKTNDPSLALTLTLILLHAGLSPGVLRASGKYVPKLLKLLHDRIDHQTMDDLIKLKDAILSRTAFTEDDFDRLRQIADRSDRFGS